MTAGREGSSLAPMNQATTLSPTFSGEAVCRLGSAVSCPARSEGNCSMEVFKPPRPLQDTLHGANDRISARFRDLPALC